MVPKYSALCSFATCVFSLDTMLFALSSYCPVPKMLLPLYINLLFMILHGLSMFAVMAKIYGVLYNQASSIAFDETSSYWSALKNS